MKTLYLKLTAALLFATMIGANAQRSFIDLSDPANYSIAYNTADVQTLSVVEKSAIPEGMPSIGVETNNVFSLKSNDVAWTWWWNAVVTLDNTQRISTTNNLLNIVAYTNSTEPMQIIIKDDFGKPVFAWEQPLKADEWQTISLDLSDVMNIDREIFSIEFCPGAANVEAFMYPYWGTPVTPTPKTAVPFIESLSGSTGNYRWDSNMGQTEGSVVAIPQALKAGLPLQTDEVFQVKTLATGDWWWNCRLNFSEFYEIKADQPIASVFVYSPNELMNVILRDDRLENGLGREFYSYPDFNVFEIIPNQWNEIKFDLTGKIGQSISMIEIVPRTANTIVYFYPVWYKNNNGTAIENVTVKKEMPALIDGQIVIKENSNIRLYNIMGQLVGSTVNGTKVTAIKGINIVVVNGVSYKLLNK